jgi:hypothetical protein
MEQMARGTGVIVKGEKTLDETLCHRVTTAPNIEAAVDELHTILDYACRSSFRQTGPPGKALRHKSVPWWTARLTTQRKEVNAKRRRYQRTKEKNELREQRREQYLASKAEYAAAIRQEKSKSWKEFWNVTSATNPWNEIYKMAAGKTKSTAHATTLRQQDGSLTMNLHDTLLQMIQKFAPDDNQGDDNEMHRQIRAQTQTPIDTEDDEEFTVQEVTNVVQGMSSKKAPGEDGIPSEVWKCLVATLPRYLTAIYNGCLKEGIFQKRWEKAKIIPIVNPGKDGSEEVNKFRPISLRD